MGNPQNPILIIKAPKPQTPRVALIEPVKKPQNPVFIIKALRYLAEETPLGFGFFRFAMPTEPRCAEGIYWGVPLRASL